MHPTGFEPVMFQRKTDYEPVAINPSATDAKKYILEWNWWDLNPRPSKVFQTKYSQIYLYLKLG